MKFVISHIYFIDSLSMIIVALIFKENTPIKLCNQNKVYAGV